MKRSITSHPPAQDNQMHVKGIDYMRLFASLLVMLYHYGYYFGMAGGTFNARVPIFSSLHFAWSGWIGVEIFFVISGYVITYSAAGSSPYRFARGRIKRIWPGVLLCSTFSALLSFAIPHAPPSEVMTSYARTIVLSPKGPWIDGVYWTLVIEIIFYAIIYLSLRLRGPSGLKIVAGGLTMWSSLYWIAASINGFVHAHAGDYICGLLLLRHGCLFAFGMYIYILQTSPRDKQSGGLAMLAVISCVQEILHQATAAAAAAHSDFITLPVFVWAASILFMLTATWTGLRTAKSANGSNVVARTLGRMTYPVYLLHGTIGSLLLPILPSPIGVGVCMIIVLGLSALVIAGPEQFIARKLGPLLDRVRTFVTESPSGGPVSLTP